MRASCAFVGPIFESVNFPIYQIDAFTNRLFSGNPAAVVILKEWLPDDVLQNIAAENNLSETAFVIPREDTSLLRWFTPTIEVDLCGHATLAAAHVLFGAHYPKAGKLAFSTLSGILYVQRDGDRLSLDFPARPGTAAPVTESLTAALGAAPSECLLARDLLCVFENEDQIRTMRPNLARIAELNAFAVIVSAPGRLVDFVSRFFAPRGGVSEDPVTGSAHCTLAPYWAARLGKNKLSAQQLSARGGELQCELMADRVLISGQAVEYLRGEIKIAD
jgi:PhzF family phenazine biosynthesis protein